MSKVPPNWLQFEHETRHLVEAFGYRAETTKPSHDFGVDVIAKSNQRDVVIQCKLYGKGRIGGDTMMKLVGSRAYFKATDAICITTSRFTKQAEEIALNENIKLIDREMLRLLCRERNLTIPSLTAVISMTGESFSTESAEVTIGRDTDNTVVLPFPEVSRHHAVLRRDTLHLQLSDLSSTNGTMLNEERITKIQPLNYGDRISIGRTVFGLTMKSIEGRSRVKI